MDDSVFRCVGIRRSRRLCQKRSDALCQSGEDSDAPPRGRSRRRSAHGTIGRMVARSRNSACAYKAGGVSQRGACDRKTCRLAGLYAALSRVVRGMVRESSLTRAGAELVHSYAVKCLFRLQFGRRELGVVGRVRKVLSFQAECVSCFINPAFFAGAPTTEKIPGVELNPRLGGENPQNPAAVRLIDFGRFRQFVRRMIQHKVVIVAMTEAQLCVVRIDPLSDFMRLAKVEWRAFH